MSLQAVRFVDKATGQRMKLTPKGAFNDGTPGACGDLSRHDDNALCTYLNSPALCHKAYDTCRATSCFFEVVE